jgi:hypothetical protein
LPPELAEALQLRRGDRVLAWSSLVGGGAAVALIGGLRILTPRGELLVHEWVDVDHATWDKDSSMLLVWWVGSRRPTPLEVLDDVGGLPLVVREQVQSSVLLTVGVALPGRAAGRVALRRTASGRITAQALLPPGVSEDDPEVKEALAAAMDTLWTEAGDDLRPQFAPDDRPPAL